MMQKPLLQPFTMIQQLLRLSGLVLVCATLVACNRGSVTTNSSPTALPASTFAPDNSVNHIFTSSMQQLTAKYLEQIETDFTEVNRALTALQSSETAFLLNPSTTTMDALRESWLSAHIAYELTTLHRYFAERLMSEAQGAAWFQLQYQLNQWPIWPGYLDYVEGYPDSGVIHDITVPLTKEDLRAQNGLFDISETTLGFHVIEFLLWGGNENDTSPRPATDYYPVTELEFAQDENELPPEQLPSNRRRLALQLITDILMEDFNSLQSIWTANNAAMREQLQAMQGPQLLSLLVNSMTDMLTEELLVRSLYPLLNGEYSESISSPFSHSTQNTVSAQLSGFERLLLESATNSGVTLDGLISTMSEDFADFFYENFDASKECLVVLYSTLESPTDPASSLQAEFDIVECINLVTNMIDHLGQIATMTTGSTIQGASDLN